MSSNNLSYKYTYHDSTVDIYVIIVFIIHL